MLETCEEESHTLKFTYCWRASVVLMPKFKCAVKVSLCDWSMMTFAFIPSWYKLLFQASVSCKSLRPVKQLKQTHDDEFILTLGDFRRWVSALHHPSKPARQEAFPPHSNASSYFNKNTTKLVRLFLLELHLHHPIWQIDLLCTALNKRLVRKGNILSYGADIIIVILVTMVKWSMFLLSKVLHRSSPTMNRNRNIRWGNDNDRLYMSLYRIGGRSPRTLTEFEQQYLVITNFVGCGDSLLILYIKLTNPASFGIWKYLHVLI